MNAPLLQPAPLTEDTERCRIGARGEVLSYLRQAVERRCPAAAHFGAGDFIATTLLAVNPQFEELVFDHSGDPDANARLLRSGRLTFVTTVDQVKVQFDTQRAEITMFDGLPAYRTRLPGTLLRLQYREFYRVAPPLSRPIGCRLADPRRPADTLELRVLDLSVGGLALLVPADLKLATGQRLGPCRMELPEIGVLNFDAEVRSVVEHPTSGGGALRCGLRFLPLPGPATSLVQRYVMKLQRERLTDR